MAEHPHTSFLYEQCDIPEGVQLAEWRARHVRQRRRVRIAGGVVAALATLGPTVMSVRATRSH